MVVKKQKLYDSDSESIFDDSELEADLSDSHNEFKLPSEDNEISFGLILRLCMI